MVAYEFGGAPLDARPRLPGRVVIPHLYFWKSAKWVRGLEWSSTIVPASGRRTATTTTPTPSASSATPSDAAHHAGPDGPRGVGGGAGLRRATAGSASPTEPARRSRSPSSTARSTSASTWWTPRGSTARRTSSGARWGPPRRGGAVHEGPARRRRPAPRPPGSASVGREEPGPAAHRSRRPVLRARDEGSDVHHTRDVLVPELLALQAEGKIRFLAASEAFASDHGHDALGPEPRRRRRLVRRADGGPQPVQPVGARPGAGRPPTRGASGCTSCSRCARRWRPPMACAAWSTGWWTAGSSTRARGREDPLGFLLGDGGRASLPEAAYRFARHEPGCHVVLTGTGSVDHLAENVASINGPPLPDDHLGPARRPSSATSTPSPATRSRTVVADPESARQPRPPSGNLVRIAQA